jgi:hypothetical protein
LLDPWPHVIRETTLRIQLGELPARTGDSGLFKQRIDAALVGFQQRWGWLISPLVVPVGLQVIFRPNPLTPPGAQHDLDNVVRDYLLPKIVAKFGTVSAHIWTVDSRRKRAFAHPTAPETVDTTSSFRDACQRSGLWPAPWHADPESSSGLCFWIPGSRRARPGMTS